MKRGTLRHPKLAELAASLNIPIYAAAGILESIWHFTSEFAHAGDIGRFSDDAIARAICWDHASEKLIRCLVDCRWLDSCDCHRLRVHDWPDHADQTVQRVLHKRHQGFLSCYDHASMKLGSSYDETSQPSPSPSPIPIPTPSPRVSVNGHGPVIPEKLLVLFNRKAGEHLTYAEQCALLEINRSQNFQEQLDEICAYRKLIKPEEVRFFPQSLSTLLSRWQETLDRARSYKARRPKSLEEKYIENI